MRKYLLALLAVLMTTSGCYRMIHKQAKREHRWMKRMGRAPDGAHAALRSARSLVRTPISSAPATLFRYRMMAIRTITLIMEIEGFDAELDAEAHGYYEEALKLGDPVEAKRELVRMYELTGRRGKVGPLLAEIEAAASGTLSPQQEYEKAISMWRRQFAMGDLAASELAWARAEELAKTLYDVDAAFPADFGARGNLDASAGRGGLYTLGLTDWRARYQVLRERMFMVASAHDSPTGRTELREIKRLWSHYERIGMRSSDNLMGQKTGDTYRVYVDGARVFSIAGQHAIAETIVDIAESAAVGEASSFRRTDLACVRAVVATRAGKDKAHELAEKCLELAERSGRELDIGDLVALGEAFERVGKLDRAEQIYRDAIERAERQRDSFPVEERTVFFRTSVRRGYWGLARTLARRSALGGAGAARDFAEALRTTEQVRARQLGELLAESGRQLGKVGELSELQARLGPDAILLDYVAMDHEVMLLAVTKQAFAVRFIALDDSTVAHATKTIASGLATHKSSAAELDESLTLLGRALLLPVDELVKGKQRVVVLPDGALNAVPFDLLDLETSGYRPLLERADVELTPSLAFMLAPPHTGSGTAMLGVADPAYGAIPELAMNDEGSRAAARAASEVYFTPLPETRREVDAIARTIGGTNQLLYGAEARESTLKRLQLRGFGIVHFATHGILGRDVPGIDEPALVLAGENGEDGFLTASEASKLQLDAKLTVLSACKTGAGDSASGEGVLGMSRAFMVAGSRSVLVSLWSVDSLATEALMVEFYRRMNTGESPATALRKAKLAVRDGTAAPPPEAAAEPIVQPTTPTKKKRKGKTVEVAVEMPVAAAETPRRDHPYYWGAFILVGG